MTTRKNQTSMERDVIIIGGGPAGCAAALALLRRKYSVALIATPNHKQRPTETAAPALRQLLRSLDASEALAACEPCYGILSAWGREFPALKPAIADPNGHAWFIHRARFDESLQRAVRERGGEWLAEEAQCLVTDADSVSILTETKPVRARWVVLATGSPASAAMLTGQKANQLDSLIAFWAHIPAQLQERLLFVEPADLGWWYLCPADGPSAMACFVTDPLSARSLSPSQTSAWNELFQATRLSWQFPGERRTEQIHAALTGLAALHEKHGPRWIAVGDAAMKLDPLGSSGTVTALDSGQRAAHAIAHALQGNSVGLDRYGHWANGLVEEFTRQRRHHYASEARRHADGFWSQRLRDAA